jgi:hypothetical protein
MRCFEYPLVIELNKLIKRNIVMDFNLTEEQLMIQQAARILLKVNCCQGSERDEFSKFPRAGQKNGRNLVLWNDG